MASVSFFRGLCSEAEWASNYFPDYLSQVTHGTSVYLRVSIGKVIDLETRAKTIPRIFPESFAYMY